MVSKRPVTKAASAAAAMSILAVPYAVMAQPATVTPPVVLHPIQDLTLAKGTKKTIDLSHLGSFRVDNSVSSVVYATYSSAEQKYVDLKGLDQEGPTVITITDNASNQIVEQFKVHVLDAGNDERIDIGDITKYIASHPADVTQASDVRTLLNGVEPFNTTKVVNNPPIVVGKPGTVYLVNGEPSAPKTVSMATYFSDDTTLSYSLINPPAYLNANIQELSGMLTINGVNLPVNETRTEWLTVQARNEHGLTATIDVEIFINAKVVNNPPKVSEDAVRSIDAVQNKPFEKTIDLSTVFTDDPGDELVYKIESVLPNGLTASFLSGNTIIVSGTPTQAGDEYRIVLSATDSSSASVLHEITVRVAGEEQPVPELSGQQPEVSWKIGETQPQTVVLSTYFKPTSGLTYTIEEIPTFVTASIQEGNLIISGISPDSNVGETAQIKVMAANRSGSVILNVPISLKYPIPVLTGANPPTIELVDPGISHTISLSEYFLPPLYDVRFEVQFPDFISISVDTEAKELQIVGTPAMNEHAGEAFEILVTAYNQFGQSPVLRVPLQIKAAPPIYTPPVVVGNPGALTLINRQEGQTQTITMATYFNDITSLRFSLVDPLPAYLDANIHELSGLLTINGVNLPVNETRTEWLPVQARNEHGLTATINVEVNVQAAPPVVIDTPGIVTLTNRQVGIPQTVSMATYFQDSSALSYSIAIKPDYLSADINGTTGELTIYSANMPSNDPISTYIQIQATNMYGKQTTLNVGVNIGAAPPAIIGSPASVTLLNGQEAESQTRAMSAYFSDTTALSYEIITKPEYVTASIDEATGILTVLGAALPTNETRTDFIEVQATNTYGQSSALKVPVTIEAATPAIIGSPADVKLINGYIGAPQTVNMATYFWDSVPLTYSIGLNPYNVDASIETATGELTIRGLTQSLPEPAIIYVQIQATNTSGKTATVNVPITIESPAFLYHNQDDPMPLSALIAGLFGDISATHFEITRPPGGTLTAIIEQNDSADARIVFDGIAEETFLVVKGANPTTGASVERKIRFIFNQSPQVTDIPVAPILAEKGTPLVNVTRDLNGLFIDQPGQNLVYSIEEMGSSSGLEASVEGGVLHVAGTPVSPGWYSFYIRATDPKGLYASRQVEVQVVNRPEAVVTPETVEWVYGVTQNKVLNGSEYFGEGGWEFTYSIETPAEVAAFIDSETGELIIQNVNPMANGTYITKVKATNRFGTNAVVDIPIHVKLPTTISWSAGAAMPYEFDFSTYFTGTGATQFEVSSSYPGVTASIVEETQQLQLSGVQADTLVTIKGTNVSSNTTTEVLLHFFTDYPVPVLDGSPASPETIEVTNGPVMEERFTPYLSSYFEGQTVTFELMPYTNPAGYVDAQILDDRRLVVEGVYFPDNLPRTTSIDVKVTNERNKSTTISFPVVVRAMPAPEVKYEPDTLYFYNGINRSYDINPGNDYFDQKGLDFVVENKAELMSLNIRADMDGNFLYVENVAPINITEDLNLTVNLIATDPFNQSTRLQIPIVIKPVNNEPVISSDSIDTIYMDTFDDRYNVIDLKLLNLFTDSDEGDSISGYDVAITGPVTGYVTVDQYLFLTANSLEPGAAVTITAHDQANHTVSKTIQIANSPIGDTYSQVNPGIPFQYSDEFLPALPADPEDQSRKIYLIDPNNVLFYNTTYNSAAGANEITITNLPSSVNISNVTLNYVNKVDHTLTLDVFDIAITV
ncbi:hypothetical protein DVH26_03190 [Paenibacillus sp. H1-7]|uniref:putative Ig domain-containing protein n=1 Tax=Paenibacillus sp. H1-7 TaxID=2282849 RepID=UPI001EF8B822|nr:putative Ig domain-containing protein [Paenibacillus sp. H1-7]ULL13543.1 hypothetical protein DVH26_03190 [Paenibacillus sp. H1-7]